MHLSKKRLFAIIQTAEKDDTVGKILSTVIAFLGIGLVAVPTGIISAGFMETIDHEHDSESDKEEMSYCPYCGKKLH